MKKFSFLKENEELASDEATTDLVADFFFEKMPFCESHFMGQ